MKCIDRHISYLISRHDCVIVPGWGAFVAQHIPARINRERSCIVPPSRQIGFNPSLNHNDGLLASSIARANGISYDSALETVSEQVASLRTQLQAEGEVSMGHIGNFTDKGNGIVEFQPFATPITSPSYYGLASKTVTTIIKTAKAEEARKASRPAHRRSRLSTAIGSTVGIAAAIALLIIGLRISSTSIIVNQKAPSMASVSSITTIIQSKSANATSLLPTSNEPTLYLAATNDGVELADTAKRNHYIAGIRASERLKTIESQATEMPSLKIDDSDPYCLIVASLATEEDAELYMSQCGDENLRVLPKNGKYRVYAATGTSVSEALAPTKSSTFSKRYPGAWVCRR